MRRAQPVRRRRRGGARGARGGGGAPHGRRRDQLCRGGGGARLQLLVRSTPTPPAATAVAATARTALPATGTDTFLMQQVGLVSPSRRSARPPHRRRAAYPIDNASAWRGGAGTTDLSTMSRLRLELPSEAASGGGGEGGEAKEGEAATLIVLGMHLKASDRAKSCHKRGAGGARAARGAPAGLKCAPRRRQHHPPRACLDGGGRSDSLSSRHASTGRRLPRRRSSSRWGTSTTSTPTRLGRRGGPRRRACCACSRARTARPGDELSPSRRRCRSTGGATVSPPSRPPSPSPSPLPSALHLHLLPPSQVHRLVGPRARQRDRRRAGRALVARPHARLGAALRRAETRVDHTHRPRRVGP